MFVVLVLEVANMGRFGMSSLWVPDMICANLGFWLMKRMIVWGSRRHHLPDGLVSRSSRFTLWLWTLIFMRSWRALASGLTRSEFWDIGVLRFVWRHRRCFFWSLICDSWILHYQDLVSGVCGQSLADLDSLGIPWARTFLNLFLVVLQKVEFAYCACSTSSPMVLMAAAWFETLQDFQLMVYWTLWQNCSLIDFPKTSQQHHQILISCMIALSLCLSRVLPTSPVSVCIVEYIT